MKKLENDLCNKLKEYVDLKKEIIMTETKLIKVHVYHIYWANAKAYKIIAVFTDSCILHDCIGSGICC